MRSHEKIDQIRQGIEKGIPKQLAIPCGRFSSSKQEQGDSTARQTRSAKRLSERWFQVIGERKIFDMGLSAFHGDNFETGEIGELLKEIESGVIKADAYGRKPMLLFEAVDRLTRLPPMEANEFVKRFVQNGVGFIFDDTDMWIDAETINDEWSNFQRDIENAYRYSKKLQKRMNSSWDARRDSGKPITSVCPKWLTFDEKEGCFKKNDRAAIVYRACMLAIDGKGAEQIRKELGISGQKDWQGLTSIFRSRALIGEFQPCKREGKKKRVEIKDDLRKDYYPVVLTEAEWFRLQEAQNLKMNHKSKRGACVTNLFGNLLWSAVDGSPLWIQRLSRGNKAILKSKKAIQCQDGAHKTAIDYDVVENCLLSAFTKITTKDLFPVHANDQREINDLVAKIGRKKEAIAEWESEALEGARGLSRLISKASEEVENLEIEMETLKRRNACQSSDIVGETLEALDFMRTVQGDELLTARLKIRTLISGSIEKVDVNILNSKSAEFMVRFKGGKVLRAEGSKGGWQPLTVVIGEELVA